MPKVSDAHREARREQVLDAAWRCFAVDGFHSTTMAAVIAASGLSAGAVYSYFRSKEDLVRVTAERALGTATDVFEELLSREPAPDLTEAMSLLLTTLEETAATGRTDLTRVALQAWAESLRSEPIGQIARQTQLSYRVKLAVLVRRIRDSGGLPPATDPEAVAQVLLSMIIGYLVQRLIVGDLDPQRYAAGIGALLGSSPG